MYENIKQQLKTELEGGITEGMPEKREQSPPTWQKTATERTGKSLLR